MPAPSPRGRVRHREPTRFRSRQTTCALALAGAALAAATPAASAAVTTFTTPGQSYTVPSGITTILIQATGAQGGGGQADFLNRIRCLGGPGAVTKGTLRVTPGQRLYVQVGGAGGDGSFNGAGTGGTNGGGGASNQGGGGGGASDVRTLPASSGLTPTDSRLLIAGGGGGSGSGANECSGGTAGATAGGGGPGSFDTRGGGGGTSSAGGAPGGFGGSCIERRMNKATAGLRGQGGAGGWEDAGNALSLCTMGGGGGGGGRFGGGGGAGGQRSLNGGGGGGAGSSYVAATLTATSVTTAPHTVRTALDPSIKPAGGSVAIDATIIAPTAQIAAPATGAIYLPGQSVATSFSCTEGLNGAGLQSCSDSGGRSGVGGTIAGTLDTSQSGTFTYTVTARSRSGGTGTASITYRVAAPPTVALAAPASGGLYAVGQSVATSFSCAEGLHGPGIASCLDGAGATSPGTLDTRTPGTRSYTVTATSGNGLTGRASITYTVAAAPSARITAPASGGLYAQGQTVRTTFTCADGASGPGIDTCRDGAGAASPGTLDTSQGGTHTYTVTARSRSGQTATTSITYTVAEPPFVGISRPGASDFYLLGAPATSEFRCVEGRSGPGILSCLDERGATSPGTLDTSTAGDHEYTVTAISRSGQRDVFSRTYTVVGAPQATISAPADGGLFAVGETVPTQFTCQDGASGPGLLACTDGASGGPAGALDTSTPGTFTYEVFTRSRSGFTGRSSITYTVAAAPTATISAPQGGRLFKLGEQVEATFACAEGESGPGLATCRDGAGADSPGRLDTSIPGQHLYTVTATSRGGQTATTSIPYEVAAPPKVTISAPEPGGTYAVGARVAARFSCEDGVSGPGITSCLDGAGSSGVGFLDTESPGAHTYTVTAVSGSGQSTTASITYTVAAPAGTGGTGGTGSTGGSGGGAGGTGGSAGAGGAGEAGAPQAPLAQGTAQPGATFALLKATGSKAKKTIGLSVRVPGPGTVRVTAPGYRTVSRKVNQGGVKAIKLTPTAKTRLALAKARKPKVKVTLRLTPRSGPRVTIKASVPV